MITSFVIPFEGKTTQKKICVLNHFFSNTSRVKEQRAKEQRSNKDGHVGHDT